MINVVTDFGAQNNGIGSNYTPFLNALTQAKNNGGDEVYFPPGVYKIKGNAGTPITPISLTGFNKVRLYGKGAVIICDTDAGILNVIGDGGGFAFDGSGIIVEDLEIIGMQVPINTTTYGYGRLLQLNGENNTVRNCYFKYGNGGALNLYGSYVTIADNRFDQCNNYALPSADYGAIQIGGGSKYFHISGNFITDQFYSGICCYGDLESTDIVNNYIRSYSASGDPDHSMGIFFLGGSYTRVKIIGNTIERIDAEGIIMAMDGDHVSSHCIIANNIIKDCAYRGISLDISNTAKFRSFTIADNVIENTAAVPVFANHIAMTAISDSIVSGNRLTGSNQNYGIGILFSAHCPGNQVIGNHLTRFSSGINFFNNDESHVASGGTIADNILRDCDNYSILLNITGNAQFRAFTIADNTIENTAVNPHLTAHISLTGAPDSIVSGNRLMSYTTGTGTGILLGANCPRNQITGNHLSGFGTGIAFFSPDGTLSDNTVINSSLGININYCRGSNVHGNLVKFCTTGIETGTDPAPQIYGNSVTDCTNRFSGTAIQPELLTHTGTAAGGNYSAFMVTGTLSSGVGTITFYNVFANDQFLVLPLNLSSDVQGALYISAVNTTLQTITVRSTLATDSRSFIVIKLLAGG